MNILKMVRTITVLITPIIFLLGYLYKNFNVMYLAAFIVFVCNIIFSLENVRERIVFLCFNGTFFLFLMGVQFVGLIHKKSWWEFGLPVNSVYFACLCVYISCLFLYFGANLSIGKKSNTIKLNYISYKKGNYIFLKNLQTIALVVYVIAVLCSCLQGVELLTFMNTHTYIEYYTSYVSAQPIIVRGFIQIMLPSMCVFLSTRPIKRLAFTVLLFYLITTLPVLIAGQRNPTMLACMFIFVYYIIRDYIREPNEEKWMGKIEKSTIIALVPLVIIFLLIYTELRNGIPIQMNKLQAPFSNFLEEQSTTFKVLARGYAIFPDLPDYRYFLGQTYDRISSVGIVRQMFDIPVVKQGQVALELSHNSSTHLSYALLGQRYFQGHGVGTSYIIDLFLDFKWVGVALFNYVLGSITIMLPKWFSRHWLIGTLILANLTTLFFIPRANAMHSMQFSVSPYFWIGVAICYIGALLITPKTYQGESKYINLISSKYIK